MMEAEYDFSQGKRGTVDPASSGKTRITIRLDSEILDWFREQAHLSGGGNYQTLINEALRHHIHHERKPIEETFRRVLREELKRTHDKTATGIAHWYQVKDISEKSSRG